MKTTRMCVSTVAAFAALGVIGPATVPARADSADNIQKQKNDWRNLGIGAGAIALHGAVRGNGLETVLGAAGAAYAGKRYEDTRRQQDEMQRQRQRYHRRMSDTDSNYVQGGRKYYWYQGKEYYLDLDSGQRYPTTVSRPSAADQDETTTITTTRVYHRRGMDRKYYTFQGHEYYLDLNTGERVFVY
jgi:hypothetical protein